MDKTDFDYNFYLTTLRTADAVGMTVVKKDDLARVLAIILNDGRQRAVHLQLQTDGGIAVCPGEISYPGWRDSRP